MDRRSVVLQFCLSVLLLALLDAVHLPEGLLQGGVVVAILLRDTEIEEVLLVDVLPLVDVLVHLEGADTVDPHLAPPAKVGLQYHFNYLCSHILLASVWY